MAKEELTELQKKDLQHLRIVKEFEDKTSKGSIIIDDVSSETFLEFAALTRKYFGGKRGASFAALTQMFLAEKQKQKSMGDQD